VDGWAKGFRGLIAIKDTTVVETSREGRTIHRALDLR